MSEVKIKRRVRSVSFALSTGTSSSTTIRLDDMAGGAILIGTLSTSVTKITMYGSTSESGTFAILAKSDGSAAEITLSGQTTSSRIYSLPDEVFNVPFVKAVPDNAAGSGVSCQVTLKS